jgi:hypothetical protein
VKSGEEVNIYQVAALKVIYFKTEYFVKDNKLKDCEIRYKIGDTATISKYNNKGKEIVISSIAKFPDDPDKQTGRSTFGAYYFYEFDGIKRLKKDSTLE